MAISEQELRERLRRRPKAGAIAKAIKHQDRLKFHVYKTVQMRYSAAETDFMAFVKNLLTEQKFDMFRTLFRYPIVTSPVCELVFKKLSRIFDGQNPTFDYLFYDSSDAADWEAYRFHHLDEPEVWEEKAWKYFKTEINSILVCDLPREQRSEKPEPYFYWVRIEDVIDFEAESDGQMRFVVFKSFAGEDESGKRRYNVVVIDDERYRVYDESVLQPSTAANEGFPAPLADNPHDLGYCPAHWFWNDAIDLTEPDVKESPLTGQLEHLDWYAFFATSKKHLDLYGSYPIYSGYEEECDYADPTNGTKCDHGYLRGADGQWLIDHNGNREKCPKCGKNPLDGAGNYVTVPVPGKDWAGNDIPDMRNPIQMLTVDVKSLDFNVNEQERLRDLIINSVVGNDESLINEEAVNEKQVDAGFESQTNVLFRLKKGFEKIQKWADSTCCRLRYGAGFIDCNINYGTRFFLQSVAELWKNYKDAKEQGASEAVLDAIYDQIIVTEYRTNPQQMRRMRILGDLEPYRHLTREEVKALYDAKVIDEATLKEKMLFSDLVKRFERENINVLEFGEGMPYDKKIEKIAETLKSYVGDTIAAQQTK
ncbi:MAG: hypothetical protein II278_06310 [Bacteroidaceae bacterium]|nr:hypothetical protein [Bacteroidaceae bacterium]